MRIEAANSTTGRSEWLVALALVGAGVALRLWVASRSAVEHFDEGVYASNLYFGEPQFTYPMQHLYAPPLLPSLIEAGMIAGLPPNVAAILPSLLAGCAMLVAVWRIGRRWFGPTAGLAALTLASLSDFHIAYSATALTDVLLTLFVLLAVVAAARALASAVGEGRDDGLGERHVDKKPDGARLVMQPAAWRRGAKRPARERTTDPVASQVPAISANLIDKWAVVAGLLTAAAWWTKYNGWLPLAIAVAGAVWLMLISSAARAKWQRILFVLVLIGATAAVAWSPVPFGLREVGGYASVAANHATYVVGPAGWLAGATRQIANQSAMEGMLSWLSVPAALMMAWIATRWMEGADGASRMRPIYVAGWAIGLCMASVIESSFVVLLVVSAVAFATQFLPLIRDRSWKVTESQIGLCLLVAWFGGLLLATPNYWPYPRLVMPLLACLWLAAGMCFSLLVRGGVMGETPGTAGMVSTRRLSLGIPACLVLLLPVAHIARSPLNDVSASLGINRTGIRGTAFELTALIARDLQSSGDGRGCVIFVQAEPALVFQLRAAGFPFVQPVVAPPKGPAIIQDKPIPTYYVFGPHANRDSQFVEQWRDLEKGFAPLNSNGIDPRPSNIVLFDSADRRTLPGERETVWLYRAK